MFLQKTILKISYHKIGPITIDHFKLSNRIEPITPESFKTLLKPLETTV